MADNVKFQKFLEEGRKAALENKAKEMNIVPSPEDTAINEDLGQLFSVGNMDATPAFEAAGIRQQMQEKELPGTIKIDAQGQPVANAPILDRADLYKSLVNNYLRKKFPHAEANLAFATPEKETFTKEGETVTRPGPRYDLDLKHLVKSTVKDITGEDIDVEKMAKDNPKFWDAYGLRDPKTGKIELRDLSDVSTAIHEALHQKYKDAPEVAEVPQNIAKTKDLVGAIRDINAGHIPEKLSEGPESEGEAAAIFKRMQEMDAEKSKPTESPISKVLNTLSSPQRHALASLADKLGVKGDLNSSEASAQAIVEGMAERLGVPPESLIGNIAKASAVAGLEVFGDPLMLMPGGQLTKGGKLLKMFKGAGKVASATEKAAEVAKAAQKAEGLVVKGGQMAGGVLKAEEGIQKGQKIVQRLTTAEDIARRQANETIAPHLTKALEKAGSNEKARQEALKAAAEWREKEMQKILNKIKKRVNSKNED